MSMLTKWFFYPDFFFFLFFVYFFSSSSFESPLHWVQGFFSLSFFILSICCLEFFSYYHQQADGYKDTFHFQTLGLLCLITKDCRYCFFPSILLFLCVTSFFFVVLFFCFFNVCKVIVLGHNFPLDSGVQAPKTTSMKKSNQTKTSNLFKHF